MLKTLKQRFFTPSYPAKTPLGDPVGLIEECNRYFREMDELGALVRGRHFDDDDPEDRQLAERVLWLFRLRHGMARAKAHAALALMRMDEYPYPARTVHVSGRTFRVFNGGCNDRFGQLLDELIDAICRADPQDPQIVRIVRRAAALCRERHLPHQADLLLDLL